MSSRGGAQGERLH